MQCQEKYIGGVGVVEGGEKAKLGDDRVTSRGSARYGTSRDDRVKASNIKFDYISCKYIYLKHVIDS